VSEVTYYRWRQEFGGLKIEQVKRLKDLELENGRLRKAVSDLTLDKLILQAPTRRRACIEQVRAQLHVSGRACAALGQHHSTQRKIPRGRGDEERLTADTIELARQYGPGPMTSSRIAPTMVASTGCSTCSTSSPTNV
jgi:putative transposase